MKNTGVQAVIFCTLALGGCRAEPSRARGSGAQSSTAQAPAPGSTPAASAVPPAPAALVEPTRSGQPTARTVVETFDDDAVEAAPTGFSFARTGSGAVGRWIVQSETGARSASHVLAQDDADAESFRFPVAVVNEPVVKDVSVSVRCKLISGRVDQACGLVARYRDPNNYFVTRANALEHNIRLYTVREGKRKELASHDGEVTPNVWHEYRFELRGDHLQVFWDGQRVLDHHDGTFPDAGRVGVWTKADSITHFDDLRVEAFK